MKVQQLLQRYEYYTKFVINILSGEFQSNSLYEYITGIVRRKFVNLDTWSSFA